MLAIDAVAHAASEVVRICNARGAEGFVAVSPEARKKFWLDRARTALENAVRALPGYALAQENLGDVYLRMAARAYERAGQLDPRNADSRNKLALARELLAKVAPRAAAAPK